MFPPLCFVNETTKGIDPEYLNGLSKEERELITETEVYLGGNIDGKDNGPELGIWELDLRSQFPLLFTSYEESRAKIPHSETIEKCSGWGSEITDSLG